MRRLTLLTVTLALAAPVMAGSHRHFSHDISINTHDDWDEIRRCDQISVRIDDEPAARAEEEVPAVGLSALTVRTRRYGGVHVSGWDQTGYSIKACKAAALPSDLAGIRVSMRNGTLEADGPDGEQWMVYFLVRAPRGAILDLDTLNGPISVQHLDGRLTARAKNGPISVKDSKGNIDVQTTNGPISYAGSSGTVKLDAQNGPISVKLDGSSFDGTLDGSTHNGPLTLKVQEGYRSGIVAEAAGHGPVRCRLADCRMSSRSRSRDDDDDDDRRLEIGTGRQVIHVSTVNGPLSVKARD